MTWKNSEEVNHPKSKRITEIKKDKFIAAFFKRQSRGGL